MIDGFDAAFTIVTVFVALIIIINIFRTINASGTTKDLSGERDRSIARSQSNTSADKRGQDFFGHESGVPGSSGNGDAISASSTGIDGSGSQN